MSENPPSYPGDPSGEQPHDPQPSAEQPTYPGQQQPYPGQQQPYPGQQQPYPGQQYPAAGGQQWGTPAPKHPKATLVLILGILGVVVCGVLAPFAWVIGNRTVAEIDANPGVYEGRGEAQAGRILGMIGTALLVLSVLVFAFFVTLAIIGIAGSSTSTTTDYSGVSLTSLF
ncbi:DUF4190 domain-containing protein [Aeromicrobium duanguangcaii]|uniref:DUF4190 domain-containing protein n=1 Tax=Aeromicrobium duanguangcaii TaxID=2968086 RepID=A0ABY5KGI2_9ACTN|nr:DUF4190 domain-containing protein [Aeromicrobium duanguangcaii]MCD9153982.1 DUF4190 domain-containing protein [Aeromicrobium duanguangcaii]MCL3837717.1 DUF4190 domain-containing protein [Aeromicrobium duanguangcaii]UUI68940.1 DUF4190 domain-containing protein [Aeromicrobium duanguangcaii]